jgi:hypothetical protein
MLQTALKSLLAVAFVLLLQQQESFEGFMSGIRSNAVKGQVVYVRKDGKFALEPGVKLDEGDVIMSGADAFTELLLQPGNFLRVGGETNFQIFSDAHDRMRLKLNHGAISVEILGRDTLLSGVYSADQLNELIRVITPNAEVFITQPGIVRINVATGRTEVIVRDGEALINGVRVKEKRRAIVSNGSVTLAENDARVEDAFDVWNRERAAQVVQANKALKNNAPWSKKEKDLETSVEFPPDEKEQNNNSSRVISAKPGAINFVEAGVEFNHKSQGWTQLTEKSQLEDGDTLRTDATSYAELVLFPDMHLRLGRSSEVLLEQLSNDSISIKVLHGSVILDVARFDRKQDPEIKIGGPSTSVMIAESGIYRIDDDAITVRDGKVTLNGRSVGSCRKITQGTASDCDKNRYDNFDFWSEHRGEGELYNGRATVSRASQLTKMRQQRFRNTGFWYQQPGQTSYTFVPFYSRLFRSPYGGSYSTVLSPRPMMNRIYLRPF